MKVCVENSYTIFKNMLDCHFVSSYSKTLFWTIRLKIYLVGNVEVL